MSKKTNQTIKKKRKHKSTRRKPKSTLLKTISFILLVVFLGVLIAFTGMQLYNNVLQEKSLTLDTQKPHQDDEIIKKMRQALEKNTTKPILTKPVKNVVVKKDTTKKEETNTTQQTETTPPKITLAESIPPKVTIKKHKPYLVVMLDDVSFKKQINIINTLPFKISSSLFPPNKIHPHTTDFPKYLDFYMIHLPMEAMHYLKPEPSTLLVNDSYETIEHKIKTLRQQFPQARYINNHTGSRFTSDFEAMKKMLRACKKYHFHFIDSLTTSHSEVKHAAEVIGVNVLTRDVFIDNKADVKYIHNQLRLAVEIAKEKGQAIAIGHPRPMTLKALAQAEEILQDVETVYVKTLWK